MVAANRALRAVRQRDPEQAHVQHIQHRVLYANACGRCWWRCWWREEAGLARWCAPEGAARAGRQPLLALHLLHPAVLVVAGLAEMRRAELHSGQTLTIFRSDWPTRHGEGVTYAEPDGDGAAVSALVLQEVGAMLRADLRRVALPQHRLVRPALPAEKRAEVGGSPRRIRGR